MPDTKTSLINALIKNWQTVATAIGVLWVGFKEYDTAKSTIDDYKVFKEEIVADKQAFIAFADSVNMELEDIWIFMHDVEQLQKKNDSLVRVISNMQDKYKQDSIRIHTSYAWVEHWVRQMQEQ